MHRSVVPGSANVYLLHWIVLVFRRARAVFNVIRWRVSKNSTFRLGVIWARPSQTAKIQKMLCPFPHRTCLASALEYVPVSPYSAFTDSCSEGFFLPTVYFSFSTTVRFSVLVHYWYVFSQLVLIQIIVTVTLRPLPMQFYVDVPYNEGNFLSLLP